MKNRCLNPNAKSWRRYGGRGITICTSWLNSFETFLSDMGPRPSRKHSLDRIDNDRGYSPRNCRWVLKKDQARNRSSTKFIHYKGERMSVKDAAERSGISVYALYQRILAGWPEARWFTPVNKVHSANARKRHL